MLSHATGKRRKIPAELFICNKYADIQFVRYCTKLQLRSIFYHPRFSFVYSYLITYFLYLLSSSSSSFSLRFGSISIQFSVLSLVSVHFFLQCLLIITPFLVYFILLLNHCYFVLISNFLPTLSAVLISHLICLFRFLSPVSVS
jgi:hypothetical protein